MRLPPGQRALDEFPRFGTHLHLPPPSVPDDPVIEITGAVSSPAAVPLPRLTSLPRRELVADFHCVSGWSATNLRWEGVSFATFYREIIEPLLTPDAVITSVVFGGLDGHQSLLTLEDALGDDVLIADGLGGHPLGADHGAPARLVSPSQYGYMSTKHLCGIQVRTSAPTEELGAAHPFSKVALRGPLVKRHPRARVWEEERHPYLPARLLRPIYQLAIAPGRWLAARARGAATAPGRKP